MDSVTHCQGGLSLAMSVLRMVPDGAILLRMGDQTVSGEVITYVNAGAEQMTGYRAEELIGTLFARLCASEADLDTINRLGGTPCDDRSVRVTLRSRTGSAFLVEARWLCISDEADGAHRVVILRAVQEHATHDEMRRLQHALAGRLRSSGGLRDGLGDLLGALAEHRSLRGAGSWIPRRDGKVLSRGPVWPAPEPLDEAPLDQFVTPEQGFIGRAWIAKEHTSAGDDEPVAPPGGAGHGSAALAVPLCAGDRVIAVLALYSDAPFDDAHAAVLSGALSPLGLLLERRHVEAQLTVAASRQTTVARLCHLALSTTDLDSILEEVVESIVRALDTTHVGLFELQPDGRTLALRAGSGWDPASDGLLEIGGGPASPGPTVLAEHFASDRTPALLVDHGIIGSITVPIGGPDGMFGVLGAFDTRAKAARKSDLHFLQMLASVLTAALCKRRAEEVHSRLAAIVASSHDAVIGVTLDRMIVSWNGSAERLYGYATDEILGRPVSILSLPGRPDEIPQILDEVLRDGRAQELETTRSDPAGRRLDLLLTASPIMDPRGNMIGAATLVRDITARKKAELALQDSEVRLRAIVETAVDGIITTDGRGVIETANSAAGAILGTTGESLVGTDIRALMPTIRLEPHTVGVGAAPGGAPLDVEQEVECRRRTGERLFLSLAVNEMRVGGELMFTAMLRDVTRRKAAETELERYRQHLEELVETRTSELESSHERLRLSERLASIGTLAAGLGHDMNNVLFPVHCRLDSVESVVRSPQARRDLQAVRQSLNYLQKLSDGLRMLALDPSDASASPTSTRLSTWWSEVEPLIAKVVPRHCTLGVELGEDTPDVAIAPHSLTQAVFNLVVNAGEATGVDGRITVAARALGDRVRVSVGDNGCGMASDIQRQALDPFFTTKKRGISTGLGLSLVRSIAESARGTVEIVSTPNGGTVVSLTLPARALPDEEGVHPAPAALTLSDDRIAGAASMFLERRGFASRRAGPGEPGDAVLWLTDSAAPGDIERFLRAGGRRAAILLTDDGEPCPGGIVVRRREGIRGLRRAINDSIAHLGERACRDEQRSVS